MTLDPKTKVANLLRAIPSANAVLKRLNILTNGNEDRTLDEICAESGIAFDLFLRRMNELNWNEEYKA